MLTLGDGVVDRGSYARWHTIFTSSFTHSSHVASDSAVEERYKHQDVLIQNFIQSQQHIYVSICFICPLQFDNK
jgi:hypothetical protein